MSPGAAYAEIEVMKMVTTLTASVGGTYVLPPRVCMCCHSDYLPPGSIMYDGLGLSYILVH